MRAGVIALLFVALAATVAGAQDLGSEQQRVDGAVLYDNSSTKLVPFMPLS